MRHRRLPDRLDERELFRNRLLVAGAVALLAMTVMVWRLFSLQVVEHENFAVQSDNNRIRIEPTNSSRGLIYDRNGVLLADNEAAFSLVVVPEQTTSLSNTLNVLDELVTLTERELKRFHKQRKRMARFQPVTLRVRLTNQEMAKIAARLPLLPGVDIRATTLRHYPVGAATAHIVGYTGRISAEDLENIDKSAYRGQQYIGKVGIERSYEDELRGRIGYQKVETDASGRVLRKIATEPAKPGLDLYLTIDSALQKRAIAALKGQAGSVVAINPNNGDVLAMVSLPSYDPNLFIGGIDQISFNGLMQDDKRPLFHRAVRGQYPPGSTIKPLLALAGIDNGVVTPGHEYFCPGFKQLPTSKRKYRDWKRSGHNNTNMSRAIIESCDVYFYELALALGINQMHDFLLRFGLGEATHIDLVGERSGLVPSEQWKQAHYGENWYTGETIIAGIGQGFMLTTPIQLASFTATISKHGERFYPRLTQAVNNPIADERQLLPPRKAYPVQLNHTDNWQYIISAMRGVFYDPRGSARRVTKNMPYEAAGKTGTAQVFGLDQDSEYGELPPDEKLRDHALFIAFAPIKDPQIAVAVVVEHGGSGGRVAAPIAREVMDAWLLDLSPERRNNHSREERFTNTNGVSAISSAHAHTGSDGGLVHEH